MFTCAHCHVTTLTAVQPERDCGEWIIRCPQCGADNIITSVEIGGVAVPTLRVAGYRPRPA